MNKFGKLLLLSSALISCAYAAPLSSIHGIDADVEHLSLNVKCGDKNALDVTPASDQHIKYEVDSGTLELSQPWFTHNYNEVKVVLKQTKLVNATSTF